MSLVLPPLLSPSPPLLPRSGHHTPTRSSPSTPRLSRPGTPPSFKDLHGHAITSLQPISAPSTPVTPTHFFNAEPGPSHMERCRSSEAGLGSQPIAALPEMRDGRRREVKATSLLFSKVPSREQIQGIEKPDSFHLEAPVSISRAASETRLREQAEDDKMDIDMEDQAELLSEAAVAEKMAIMQEEAPQVWGMTKWGCDDREEVRKGVRLVKMAELPNLVEQHNNMDVPSQVLFPWLHGISDDGVKGQDMAAFFGRAPPFAPPPYRGLCLLLAPPHPLDSRPAFPRTNALRVDISQPFETPRSEHRSRDHDQPREPRERSETMSTSSESYISSSETDTTSASDFQPKTPDSPVRPAHAMEPEVVISEDDVQMHPCEPMRISGITKLQDQPAAPSTKSEGSGTPETSSSFSDGEEPGPSCLLVNALHAQDIFHFPPFSTAPHVHKGEAQFRRPRLPHNINLRNLNIQQIKYSTISDIILYAKGGASAGVVQIAEMIAEAQEALFQSRMQDYYIHLNEYSGKGEGASEPVRYGVWVLEEPFEQVEKFAPHLVNLDSKGNSTEHSTLTDLFERESLESRAMTAASEVVEGFWVGNHFDAPSCDPDDEDTTTLNFDLCLRASESLEMPSPAILSAAYRRLAELDKRRRAEGSESQSSWSPSPATIALRNLLSPSGTASPLPDVGSKRSTSPADDTTPTKNPRKSRAEPVEPVFLDCAGSCRTVTGQLRNLGTMTERVVELVYFLRKLVEGRDKSRIKRRILVHCQDGYTESSIIVLSYIMSSLSISLPEAYLHLQKNAKRSFFLYPSDKPLLRRVDARLTADRKAQALKLVTSPVISPSPNSFSLPTSTSPVSNNSPLSSRWKAWGFGIKDSSSTSTTTNATAIAVSSGAPEQQHTIEVARQMLLTEENGGSKECKEAKVWFDDKRFDGFPSRILDFMYLGNLEHAGNAAMLHALGITHIVSVGESLISCPTDCDPMYGQIGSNTLSAEYVAGRIKVLDLNDIRDDGNDPLRPLIARACAWIEEARQGGGIVLVHCRVGVSRSASIVMAYMMQHRKMGLMDAYLMTRARRLNVLIQPNLRFFHELFGWEVELAKAEEKVIQMKKEELERNGIQEGPEFDALKRAEEGRRKIYYTWPSFCRDLHCLNRRFLCN